MEPGERCVNDTHLGSALAPRPRRWRLASSSLSSIAAGVRVVGLDHEEARVTLGEQLVVEAVAVDVDVGEAAPVDVVGLDVVLEPDDPAREPALRVRGRLRSEAFHRLRRVVRLGRVDAESRMVSRWFPRAATIVSPSSNSTT